MNHPLFFLGSLPYDSVIDAVNFVKQCSPSLPFLPQLPEANPQEDMVGQVLRGIELGHWDEQASSCLEYFQNEFVDAPRFKIQLAGPMTVARSLSTQFDEVTPSWMQFLKGLMKQLRQAGFQQEMWLQIDEPFWSSEVPLPPNYVEFLGEVRKSREKLKIGLHSCHKNRPKMDEVLAPFTDFFSFNYSVMPTTVEEIETWNQILSITDIHLVLGVIAKGVPFEGVITPFDENFRDRLWVSPACGLYDWTSEDIQKTFQFSTEPSLQAPLAGPGQSRIDLENAKET